MSKRIVPEQDAQTEGAPPRRLQGARLHAARLVFVLIALTALGLFVAGIPAEYQELHRGQIGLEFFQNEAGQIVVSPVPGQAAARAGVLEGDILVAVNAAPISPHADLEDVRALVGGEIGEQVSIQVRSGGGPARGYSLVQDDDVAAALEKMHLSIDFLAIYLIVFHVIFVTGFTLVAAILFLRKSDDWLILGVALALVTYAVRAVPEMYVLDRLQPALDIPVALIGLLGVTLPLWFLYLFPNGKFIPRWTAFAAVLGFLWYAAFFLPGAFNPIHLPPLVIFLAALALYGVGILAQVYRYRRVASLAERQQTKWVVLGLALAFLVAYGVAIPMGALVFVGGATSTALHSLVNRPIFYLGMLILPLTIGVSITRRRLWDVDVYINRAVVYTTVIGLLGLLWNAAAAVLENALEEFVKGKSAGWALAISGLGVAGLFVPLRNRIEKWINRRFYPDRVDFEAALVELRPDFLEVIALADLYHALATTVPALLQSVHGAVYAFKNERLRLVAARNLSSAQAARLKLDENARQQLCKGKVVQLAEGKTFSLLVPFHVPRGKMCDLIGLLALGARAQGRGYSRDHLADLESLGSRAGTAIYIVELNAKRQARLAKAKR